LGNLRKALSGLFSSNEETLQDPLEEEKPKTMLQTFLPFLTVEGRDVQFLNEQGKLTSFKRTQEPRSLPLFLRNKTFVVEHCKGVEVKVSFEESLHSCKRRIKENFSHLDRLGEILSKNVFRGPAFCPSCKVRFVFQVRFNNDKIPELLEKIRGF